jgi:hypothetical protein
MTLELLGKCTLPYLEDTIAEGAYWALCVPESWTSPPPRPATTTRSEPSPTSWPPNAPFFGYHPKSTTATLNDVWRGVAVPGAKPAARAKLGNLAPFSVEDIYAIRLSRQEAVPFKYIDSHSVDTFCCPFSAESF